MNVMFQQILQPYTPTSVRRDEEKAQQLVLPALAALRSACQDAMLLSRVMRSELASLLDALDDHAPTQKQWDEDVDGALS